MAVAGVSLQLEGLRERPSSSEQLQSVADALLDVLQVGLQGNRAVGSSVWSVVTAATRAYPIHLSPSVEKAQIVVETCPEVDLVQTWALQAIADGSFIILLQKLATQPQIVTAYAKDATVRDAKAVEQLVSLLQELKELITVTPYDSYLQQKPPESAAPAHIQTEEDLPYQSRHQQQQHQSPEGHQDVDSAPSATEHQPEQAPSTWQTQQLPAPTVGTQQTLVRLFQRNKQGKPATSSSNNAAILVSREQQQAQPAHQESEQPLLVRVQLQVRAGSMKQPVHLQLQALTKHSSSTAGSSISMASTGHSSSSLLGAGAGAVKGMFHSLQQTASAGLHHSAAAGQELGGAVAAAGEAAFGAISQPFAAVKGFAARASGRKPTGATDVSTVSQQAAAEAADGAKNRVASAAVAGSSSGRGVSSLFSKRQTSTVTAARASGSDPPITPDRNNSFTTKEVRNGATPVVQIHLHPTADATNPVQLVLKLLPETQDAGDCACSTQSTSWPSTKGLLGRIGIGHSSSSSCKASIGNVGGGATAAAATAGKDSLGVTLAPSTPATSDEQSGNVEDVLEGDMWSLMERLKRTADGVAARHGMDAFSSSTSSGGGIPGAASPAAAAASEAAQLEQEGKALLQQLLNCCHDVSSAATVTRGYLGDDAEVVVQLVELVKKLLSHGLRNAPAVTAAMAGDSDERAASSRKVPAAREVLGGWLQGGKSTPAFGVLQALQHGCKYHPRLMLGADGIATMKAAKSSSAGVKLDMWVRASLNEQLLGVRLSTLVANAAALDAWYHSQALLLQQQAMQPLLQQVSQLCDHKFALLVGAAQADASSSVTSGLVDSSSAHSSGSFVMPNASKLLGSFSSFKRGVLPGFGSGTVASACDSSDSTGTAASAAAPTAAAGAPAGTASNPGSSIPTFLWSALSGGATDSSNDATAAAAAGTSTHSSAGGGLFRRRRVAQIKEVRVPPPDSAAVLSPDASCALSPVSTAGDAAYAEWWSPNSSWQDFSNAEGSAGNASGGVGDGGLSRSSSAGGGFGLSAGGAVSAKVLWEDGAAPEQQQCMSSSSAQHFGKSEMLTTISSVQSEAALKLEQELAAAMNAPVANMLGAERARRTCGSTYSSSSRGSSRGISGHELHQSSSAGWEAAVARARSSRPSSAVHVGASLGVMGPHHTPWLQRRSRSPDASWPASATCKDSEAVGSSGAGRRVQGGHMHKRSSSLNDLPELQALLESADLLHEW